MSKAPTKQTDSSTIADQVAEFIGRTMGELLNRKDALMKQMADVDRQIADVRRRVVRQFGDYLPVAARGNKKSRTLAGGVRRARAAVRQVSEETRARMAAAARRRWARERAKKKTRARGK